MTSIRRRILLPLVPLIGIALLAAGLAVETAVRRDLQAGLDRNLLVLGRGIGAAVDVELGGELEFELEGAQVLTFQDAGGDAFYRVSDDAGETLFASGGAPLAPTTRSQLGPVFTHHNAAETRYRVCTLPVIRAPEDDAEDREDWSEQHPGEPLPAPEARRFWVTVGRPTAGVDAALSALRARLGVVLGALFLSLSVLPAWIVSRALRPLRKLSEQADRVGPETPQQRLTETGVDREVLALVAALNRALQRLSDAYARQRRFTADAAHELRTPLAALRTNCEVILRRERNSEELRGALETVHRGTLRMTDLVQDLLALSRLEQESAVVGGQAVDLAQLARDALAVHANGAREKGLHLESVLDQPIPGWGNPGLLTECVSNLLDNAVRHTPAGGTVTVGGDRQRTSLFVRDTGSGIPEQHLARVFDRFYRVDKGRARNDGGAGLGLALVREIVRLHGGEVELESRVGEGSCFTMRLPPYDGATP